MQDLSHYSAKSSHSLNSLSRVVRYNEAVAS